MNILHLEDNHRDAELAREILLTEWPDCLIKVVATRGAFLSELVKGGYDIILSDFQLPGFNGLEALQLTRERLPHVPFIFFSGTIGEERAIEAVRAGAADYVIKDRMQRLPVAIQRVMREAEEMRARRRIEDALAQEQYLLLLLMENLPDHIYFKDLDSRFITVSRSMARRLQANPDEIKGKSDFDFFTSEHACQALADEQRIIRTGEPLLAIEERETWPDGSVTWALTTKLPMHDAAGRTIGTFGVSRDITERKNAEARLRLQSSALESAANAIVITDEAGVIQWVNPAFHLLTGYTATEAIGKNPNELVRSGHHDRAFYEQLWSTILAGKVWKSEMVNRRKDGALYSEFQTITPVRDDTGRICHFVAIKDDITARKQAEERIREQAEIIDQTPLAILIADLAHRVTYVNQGAEVLFGVSRGKFVGRRAEDFFPAETMDRIRVARETTLATGHWTGEVAVPQPSGRLVPAEFHMSLIRDDAGRPRARLTIAIDLTEKKKIEAQFLRAQRLESLGMLSAGIAHDLNNILAPVLMGAPLMRARTTHPSDLRVLDAIENSASRGAALVRQILSFAHGASGERMLIQVKHLLRDITGLITETFPRKIQLVESVPNGLWTIQGNPTQLHQVVLNLCVNARDAMPVGGTLRLLAENVRLEKPVPEAQSEAPPGPYIMIAVSDTGTGIAPEVLARIWEPFFTTKGEGKGTGLGLATVRGIVTNHGGFATVESIVSAGSTFRVYFPATEQSVAKSATSQAPFLIRGQGELVLVAEDESSIRELLTTYLGRYGYRVIAATNGIEARALYAARVSEIALVITDINMPAMGGNELAEALMSLNAQVKIIFMSGADSDSHAPHTSTARILQKPFLADSLLKVVYDALHETPPTGK